MLRSILTASSRRLLSHSRSAAVPRSSGLVAVPKLSWQTAAATSRFSSFVNITAVRVTPHQLYSRTGYHTSSSLWEQKQQNDDDDNSIEHQHKNPIPPNTDPKARMMIGFTCTVCNHRSFKTMSRHAYNHGVVIMKCDECGNNHLIADHLGWFKNGGVTVEDLVKQKGEQVQRLTADYEMVQDGGFSSEEQGQNGHVHDENCQHHHHPTEPQQQREKSKEELEFERMIEQASKGMMEWIPKDILDKEMEKISKSQKDVAAYRQSKISEQKDSSE